MRNELVAKALALCERIPDAAQRAVGVATIFRVVPDKDAAFANIIALLDGAGDIADQVAARLYESAEVDRAATIVRRHGDPMPWLVHTIRKPAADAFVRELRARLKDPGSAAFLLGCEAIGSKDPEGTALKLDKLVEKLTGAPYERAKVLALIGRLRARDPKSAASAFAKAITESSRSTLEANNDAALEFVVEQIAASKIPALPLYERAAERAKKQTLHRTFAALVCAQLDQPQRALEVARLMPALDSISVIPLLVGHAAPDAVTALLERARREALDPHASGLIVTDRVVAVAVAHNLAGDRKRGLDLFHSAVDLALAQTRGSPLMTDALETIARGAREGGFPDDVRRQTYDQLVTAARSLSNPEPRYKLLCELIVSFAALGAYDRALEACAFAEVIWDRRDTQLLEKLRDAAG